MLAGGRILTLRPIHADDSRIALLRRAFEQRPAGRLEREAGEREAAVALLLRPRDALEVLLIKRTEREADPWSGHMALPGGRRDARDADLLHTAIRETQEETGIEPPRDAHVGTLDELAPRTVRLPPLVITPFVLAVPPDTVARPEPREVAAAMWIPLPTLADVEAAGEFILELEGGRRSFPSYRYREHVIWGLTHRILEQFIEVAAAMGLTRG